MKNLLLLSLLLLASAGGALAQVNNARMLSTPNSQTGTTYTFVAADTTRVVTFNNASPVAASLPNGATLGFGPGTMLSVVNNGAGAVTITCTSCTITANGTAAATLVLSQGQGADIYGGIGSPAVNYVALPSPSGTFSNITATSLTVSGTGKFANINNAMPVSQQCGGSTDLGVCINNAVANSPVTPPSIFVDSLSPTTLSTAPNLPRGTWIWWAPSIYTFAVSFPIQHRGVQWFGNGSQYNYSQDTGTAAILVGKNLTGTVNCNGTTTITLASGSAMTQFDVGDKIFVANGSFNVQSATANSVVVDSACPNQSGVRYDGFMTTSSALNSFTGNVHLRDLVVNYTGAGTNAGDTGVEFLLVDKPYTENIGAINFSTSKGIVVLGVQGGQFHNNKTDVAFKGLTLDDATAGTQAIGSNINVFLNFRHIFCPSATGYAVLIQGHSFGNWLGYGGDVEGCTATNSVQIAGSAWNNTVEGFDFEKNGDGTTSSSDIKVTAVPAGAQPGARLIANRFTSAVANTPNTGIICTGAGVLCQLDDNQWQSGDPYTSSWVFSSGAIGQLINNFPQGLTHTDPAGSFFLNSNGQMGAACITSLTCASSVNAGELALPNALFLRSAATANNTTFPLIGGNASNQVQIDPNGQGTFLTSGASSHGNIVGAEAGHNLGSAGGPWATLFLGTAATNNFVFTPAATAAARTVSLPDPGANVNLAFNLSATSSAFATATTAGTCVQNTTAVSGAATTMVAEASPVSTPGVGAVWAAFVSSAGNVTINECAVATSAGGTIAFNIRVHP